MDTCRADTLAFIKSFYKKHGYYPSKDDLKYFISNGEPSKKPITVKRKLRTKGGKSIVEQVQSLITDLKDGKLLLKSKRMSEASIEGYIQVLNLLKEFEEIKGTPLSAHKLSEESTIREIELYLTNEKQFKLNTVGKRLKNLKTIIGIFHNMGVIKSNPFIVHGIGIPKEETTNIALTEEELEELQQIDLSMSKTLDVVRDHFICMCYTGLRVSDYKEFTKMDLNHNVVELISIKTKVQCAIPILPPVRRIWEKYGGKMPPVISEQKMSQYIKVIAQRVPSLHQLVAKVETIGGKSVSKKLPKYEMISNHTARRTMITLLRRKHISEQEIMVITGHKDHRSLRTYNKMLKSESALNVLKQIEHSNDAN